MQAQDRVEAGQAVYTPLTLKIYDVAVLGVSNSYLWRCPTSKLVALYDRNVSERHLDVGVGSGYFLNKATWPVAQPEITLLDLNENSLTAASRRIARYAPSTIAANVFEPLPTRQKFRSVGLCYLLHCLPGSMAEKAPLVFDNLMQVTEPGGRIFGATILQGDAPRSAAAQALMNFYNRKGIFSNAADTFEALNGVLGERFKKFATLREGAVVIFEAEMA